ncbi:hypothetical protein SKAU_G00022690 [Synaphobranchus kaupii]|uniref:Uncharacterized protein n=1 Tax=Synaphobranchus kaupii TaxID=118154 RepID=A0A9Q1JCD3_SYNKA|nr:hypothetical protein SKAU_G00022690 [Synaphobranchus kaupii]
MVAPMPAAGRLNWILALFVLFICSSFCENSVKSVISPLPRLLIPAGGCHVYGPSSLHPDAATAICACIPPTSAHEGGFSACVCTTQAFHPRRAGSDRIDFGLLNARSIANKLFVLNELFVSKNLDFLQITETWQRADDFTSLIELCPRDCSFSYAPRSTGRGGGLATILRDCEL